MDKSYKTMVVKKKVLLAVFFSLIFAMFLAKSQLYLGTTEGYVFYPNNTPLANALVTISVRNCQAPSEYCTRTTYSQSNGYYVMANLALEPYGYVNVSAEKGNYFGTNGGQADAYGAAFVNITTCLAPSQPIIQPINDFHPTKRTYYVIFNWTSGIDPNNLTTYDMFYLDGHWQYPVTSPIIDYDLDFEQHNWSVKTCNSQCCSANSGGIFKIINNPPPAPALIDQGNTSNNSLIFRWNNVTDSDGDPVFYDFMIDSELKENVTSPHLVEALDYGYHEWRVRACDLWQCSSWARDSFYVKNKPCPKPNLTETGNICNNAAIIFGWQSSSNDSEGQVCHDQFMLNGIIIDNNATSPKTLTLNKTQIVEWGVRSCDVNGGCSEWARSSFIYSICGGGVPLSGGAGGGGGGGGSGGAGGGGIAQGEKIGVGTKGYGLFILAPNKIYQGDDFEIKLNFFALQDYKNISISIENKNPKYFSLEKNKFVIGNVSKGEEIKTHIKVSSSKNTKKGVYDFNIILYSDDTKIVYKKISIEVEEIPVIVKIMPKNIRKHAYIGWILLLLLILIIFVVSIIIISYRIYKNIKKRKKIKLQ